VSDRPLEEESFRTELRRYLERNHPGPSPTDRRERMEWGRRWAARLYDDGYAAPSWPRTWGGMELPLAHQLVYHEEMARARLTAHPARGTWICGPTLMAHGTQAQRERFLRPMLRGDELWCQGFSEPEAGSDLPALRSRAVRDGDDYVVNGQKTWISAGDVSDWMFALVRTGTQRSRGHGLSYLLIDMRSIGVDVRAIKDMAGGHHFSEVFLSDVRVPAANRVGEENQGWTVARTTLGHERSVAFTSTAIRYRQVVDSLHDLARETGACTDPLLRQRLAEAEIRVRLLYLHNVRILSQLASWTEPGGEASIIRLLHAEFEQYVYDLAVRMLGPTGLPDAEEPDDPHSRWTWGLLRARASTIGTGTAEIQRSTIAIRALGLPRAARTKPTEEHP
jgi:alkylation response protein AidB-like acyl-CoA dehydrogenase